MSRDAEIPYDVWLAQLQALANERDLLWLVSPQTDAHHDAYSKGLTPEDELTALADMAQWRGCGCGGG